MTRELKYYKKEKEQKTLEQEETLEDVAATIQSKSIHVEVQGSNVHTAFLSSLSRGIAGLIHISLNFYGLLRALKRAGHIIEVHSKSH